MQWGDKVEFLTDLSIKRGSLTPSLRDRPELPPELSFIFEAFAMLSPSRPRLVSLEKAGQRMVSGYLAISDIIAVARAFSISCTDQRLRFIRLIQVMDAAYVKRVNA